MAIPANPNATPSSHQRGRAAAAATTTVLLLQVAAVLVLLGATCAVGQAVPPTSDPTMQQQTQPPTVVMGQQTPPPTVVMGVQTPPPTSDSTMQQQTQPPTVVMGQQTQPPTVVMGQQTPPPTVVMGQQTPPPTVVMGSQTLKPTGLTLPDQQEELCAYFSDGAASLLDYSDKCGAQSHCDCGEDVEDGGYYASCTDATLQCSMTSPKVCGRQTTMVEFDDAETYRVSYNWTYETTTDGGNTGSATTGPARDETLQYVYNPAEECSLSIDNPRWGNTTWCQCFFQPCQSGEWKPFVDCTNYEENATANWCYYGLGVQPGSVLEGLVVTLEGQCEAVAIAARASKQQSINIVVAVVLALVGVTSLGVVYGCWFDRRRAAAKQKLLHAKFSVGRPTTSSTTNPTVGGDAAPIRAEVPAQPDSNDTAGIAR